MLRSQLADAQRLNKPLVLPGCYDALSARLIELAGFDAVYMTGFGTTASLLGRPDVGLLGASEMIDNGRRIASAVDLPVVADADTGYGNEINVIRTVQDYEFAGVAGIHIEDQVTPKKCGHMEQKEVIPMELMVAKLKNAVAARLDDDFVIISRTDARAPLGLDEALRRADAYAKAGADVLFVEALQDEGEVERVAKEFEGMTLLFNWAEGGKTPPLPYETIAELGFAMIISPITVMLSAVEAIRTALGRLHESGTPAPFIDDLMPFADFNNLIGLPEIDRLTATPAPD